MENRFEFLKKTTFVLFFFVLLIFGLVEARDFIVPLLLGILLSYLLYPIGKFLENHQFPRILANLVAITIAVLVIVLAVNFLSSQFSVFTEDLPKIEEQASKNWEKMRDQLSSGLGISKYRLKTMEEDFTSNLFEVSEGVKTVFSATASTIVSIGLMPVFIFCFLFYRNKFHDFILQMVPKEKEGKTKNMLSEINLVTKKYMTGVFIVVLILSIVHPISLSIIGLDYAVFLGVTAALFNFIPYFGTLIGAVIPLLFAFLTMESSNSALWVLIYFAIIQFTENNILTPNITGGYVNLNPFVTILSLIFGSMIWGVAGMLLIVPVIAMLKIFCEKINFLKPIGFLLSDKGTEKHSLSWDKIKNFFSNKK